MPVSRDRLLEIASFATYHLFMVCSVSLTPASRESAKGRLSNLRAAPMKMGKNASRGRLSGASLPTTNDKVAVST